MYQTSMHYFFGQENAQDIHFFLYQCSSRKPATSRHVCVVILNKENVYSIKREEREKRENERERERGEREREREREREKEGERVKERERGKRKLKRKQR